MSKGSNPLGGSDQRPRIHIWQHENGGPPFRASIGPNGLPGEAKGSAGQALDTKYPIVDREHGVVVIIEPAEGRCG